MPIPWLESRRSVKKNLEHVRTPAGIITSPPWLLGKFSADSRSLSSTSSYLLRVRQIVIGVPGKCAEWTDMASHLCAVYIVVAVQAGNVVAGLRPKGFYAHSYYHDHVMHSTLIWIGAYAVFISGPKTLIRCLKPLCRAQ